MFVFDATLIWLKFVCWNIYMKKHGIKVSVRVSTDNKYRRATSSCGNIRPHALCKYLYTKCQRSKRTMWFFNMPTHMVNCVGTPSKTCFHNQQYEGNIVWRSWGPKGRQSSGKRKSVRAGVVESFEWRAVFLFLNYLNLQLRRQLLWFLSITRFYKRLFSYRLLSSLIAHHVVTFFPHTILLSFLKNFLRSPRGSLSRDSLTWLCRGLHRRCSVVSSPHRLYCHP